MSGYPVSMPAIPKEILDAALPAIMEPHAQGDDAGSIALIASIEKVPADAD
jgi:hypothetical protein